MMQGFIAAYGPNYSREADERGATMDAIVDAGALVDALSGQRLPQSTPSNSDSNSLWCENKTCDTPGCENYGGCRLR